MPDREKVICHLYDCLVASRLENMWVFVRKDIVGDALTLLKEQDAVEPVVDIDIWKCGNCGHTLEHQELLGDNVLFHEQYNYCPVCGKAVKWDDIT